MTREHAFADVDAQPAPAAWVGVLNAVRREPLYAAYKQRTMELLDPQRGGRYLEVGTGTGADALVVAARFDAGVVGVDSSRVMIDEARRRGLEDDVVADAHALPFESASFDGAWADRTFQHLADPVAALAELVRVVKPGGRIVVSIRTTARRSSRSPTRTATPSSIRSASSSRPAGGHSRPADGWASKPLTLSR